MVDECCPRCPANSAKNCSVAGESNLSQFKPTQMWRSPQDPCLICSCNNGTVSCDRLRCQTTAITCGKGKILDKLPGSCCPQCVTEPGVCTVYGDPHYRTFDGRPFSFQGDCKYVLTKDCAGRNFSVIVENKRKQPTRVSWTNSVHLRLIDAARHEKRTISLHQGHVVKINEAKISLPFIDHQLLIWKENQLVKVRSNSEVGLDWDGESFLEVFVSPQFQGILCGLCGNFNGFPRDDIIGSDGLFKLKIADFAKSWKIGSSKQCTKHSIDLRIRQSTSRRVSLETSKKNFCRIFNSKKFEKCRRKIHPKRYLESCRADAKACPEGGKCSCKAIKAYISACQREGVEIMWSKQINCKETCSYGKIYSFCGDSCKQSCKSIRFGKQTTKRCRRQCVAGCFCPAGYVIRGRRCVKKSSCFYGKGLNFRSNSRNVIPFHAFLKAAGSDD